MNESRLSVLAFADVQVTGHVGLDGIDDPNPRTTTHEEGVQRQPVVARGLQDELDLVRRGPQLLLQRPDKGFGVLQLIPEPLVEELATFLVHRRGVVFPIGHIDAAVEYGHPDP